jgi:lipopolysaccharide export system permease protein
MAILTRYLIRNHVGPFLFAFTLITSLLFINTIALRLKDLVGKGLPWSVVLQVAVLALPHTVALTFPMAVLVAVLFAYSELTAENEITAMTAGGVNPVRLLMPLVGIGVILAGSMFLFNDRVLPEANHSLRKLLVDVGRKTPTLQLREQVVNEIQANPANQYQTYYIQAVHIDPVTSVMRDIVIYDVSDPQARRTTYADSGTMSFNQDQTDLFLTLYDGELREVPNRKAGSFQRAVFREQFYPIRGINSVFERGGSSDYRSDREMSTDMLADSMRAALEARKEYLAAAKEESLFAVRKALGWQTQGDSLVPPGAADPPVQAGASPDSDEGELLPRDDLTATVHRTTQTNALTAETFRKSAVEKRVEIHKKYAIAFACIVFVLIGAPLAIRFPRGGAGMVITASVVIFALFWVSLIGGEALADRGHMNPAIAMWLPNLILLPIGISMVRGMSRQVATARGGGWDDLLFTLANGIRTPFRSFRRGRGS